VVKMKLTLTLHHGSEPSEHQLELHVPQDGSQIGGPLTYILDLHEGTVDCVRIAPGVYSMLLGGRSYSVSVAVPTTEVRSKSGRRVVTVGARHYTVDVHDPRQRRLATTSVAGGGPQEVVAPMPGKIVKLLVEKDQQVAQGHGLLVIEAMKMQNELRAPRAGTIAEIYVTEGLGVETGSRLIRMT
jgi:biotin carboxyl carrier protein